MGGPASKSNAQGNSTGKDKHQEGIRQKETKKYLTESCYYRIKCYVANSLTALMWM